MKHALALFSVLLVGCAPPTPLASLCELGGDVNRADGRPLTLDAMLEGAGFESPPLAIDRRCFIGIPADLSGAPQQLKAAFDAPGHFNKFAFIAGRIKQDRDGRTWFYVSNATAVTVRPQMTEEAESAFFRHMVETRNAFVARRSRQGGGNH